MQVLGEIKTLHQLYQAKDWEENREIQTQTGKGSNKKIFRTV